MISKNTVRMTLSFGDVAQPAARVRRLHTVQKVSEKHKRLRIQLTWTPELCGTNTKALGYAKEESEWGVINQRERVRQ